MEIENKNDFNAIFPIFKSNIKKGDIIFFKIQTDENGSCLSDLNDIRQRAYIITDLIGDDAKCIFLLDQAILPFCKGKSQEIIKCLEAAISYLQEADDKATNIENGKSEKTFQLFQRIINAEGLV